MKRLSLLLLLLMTPFARADFAAPEILTEFINAWVEYDEGAYASSLRSFARVHSIDPRFEPSLDGIRACLYQMDMPEVAAELEGWGKGFVHEHEYVPELAFWGVYHDAKYDFPGVARIEDQINDFLVSNVDYPIRRVSPSSQEVEDRKEMAPCQFNLLVLLSPDVEPDYINARFHLISALDVGTNNSLDVVAQAPDEAWTYGHSVWTLKISQTDLAATLATTEAVNELRGLIGGDWQNPPAPYVVDEETLALPDFSELNSCWELYSKASITENPQFSWLVDAWFKATTYEGIITKQRGFTKWLLRHNPGVVNHPEWPWIHYHSTHDYTVYFYRRERDAVFNEDYIRENFADHAVGKMQRLMDLSLELSPENKETVLPEMRALLELEGEDGKPIFSKSVIQTYTNFIDYLLGEPVTLSDYAGFPLKVTLSLRKSSKHPRYIRLLAKYSGSGNYMPLLEGGGSADIARDADIILEINPYLNGDLEALIEKQQAMLLEAPYSPHLNFLSQHINRRCYKERDGPLETAFYAPHIVRLINDGCPWKAVAHSIRFLKFNDEEKLLIAEAMNRRFVKANYTDPLEELDSINWMLGGYTELDMEDLSPEARVLYQKLCESLHPCMSYADTNRYYNALGKSLKIGDADYVRANILERLPAARIAMAEYKPIKQVQTALNLSTYLIAAGEYEVSGELIAEHIDVITLEEANENSIAKFAWFNLRHIEAERLNKIGKNDEAIALIDEALAELDGRMVRSISKSSPYKGLVSFHLLELKKVILAEQLAAVN